MHVRFTLYLLSSRSPHRKRVEALQQRFNEETRGAKLELVLFQVRLRSCSVPLLHTSLGCQLAWPASAPW